MRKVILHDTRLDGRVEPGIGRVIQVNGNTPLAQAFRSAISAATVSPVELVIACHGYMSHSYDRASHEEMRGGQGLQLCRESLTIGNIGAVSVLNGYFSRIWLMACGPAGTIVHSSRPFCREFAHHSNTVVIASDRAQTYNPGTHDSTRRESRRVLRFRNWEGSVYQFFPDGRVEAFGRNKSPLP